jgi:hypothetical protein
MSDIFEKADVMNDVKDEYSEKVFQEVTMIPIEETFIRQSEDFFQEQRVETNRGESVRKKEIMTT